MRAEALESEQEIEGVRFAARFTRRAAPPRSFGIRRLVAAVLAGDEDAFEQVYVQFYGRLYARLSRDLRDPHEVQDLAQTIFTKAYAALREGRYDGQPFEAWLFRIARNELIDHVRKHARVVVGAPERVAEFAESRTHDHERDGRDRWLSDEELCESVRSLSVYQQQVLVLAYLGDLSTADIAVVLGRTEGAVRVARHEALRLLPERLSAAAAGPVSRSRFALAVTRRSSWRPVHAHRGARLAPLAGLRAPCA